MSARGYALHSVHPRKKRKEKKDRKKEKPVDPSGIRTRKRGSTAIPSNADFLLYLSTVANKLCITSSHRPLPESLWPMTTLLSLTSTDLLTIRY